MNKEKGRILSYKLATILEDSDLKTVSGGKRTQTVGSQRFVGTRGGDTTIVYDNYDSAL